MDGVHYGAASVLLVVLAALAARVLRGGGEGVGRPRAAHGFGVYVLSAREPR
jgi:hypothetical protein